MLPRARQLRRLHGCVVAIEPADLDDAVLLVRVRLPRVEGDGVLLALAEADGLVEDGGGALGGLGAVAEVFAFEVEGAGAG